MEKACGALEKSGQADEAAKMLNKLKSRYPEYGRQTASGE
jgi:TolA-binding protein